MRNIYQQIADLPKGADRLVLATIVSAIGSTPQKPGCSALFNDAGLVSGTIGGGILEARVESLAKGITGNQASGLYHFALDKDISQEEEAICGGQTEVLMDARVAPHIPVFERIRESMAKRTPGILITQVKGTVGAPVGIERDWITGSNMDALATYAPSLEPAIRQMLSEGRNAGFREVNIPGPEKTARFFLDPVFPLPILIIAGAGHIGKAVAHLGSLLEFEVWVADERPEFANTGNIPDADRICSGDIGQTIRSMDITPETFIVIVTRGHKHDADALKACIGSNAAYVGMIGSAGKIAMMRDKFIAENLSTPEQWASIHAPIGLDINSKTVQEIAVSIAAQLVRIRNQKIPVDA